MSMLDNGIELTEEKETSVNEQQIINPFYDVHEIDNIYPNLYILCLKNNVDDIDNMMYQPHFTLDRFIKSKDEYVLIKGYRKMIANRNHKKMMAVVDKKFLENYNSNMYEFGEVELVLCIPNITENDILPYIELYSENKKDITATNIEKKK